MSHWEREYWTNPQTDKVHCIGQRVMWVHGKQNYVEYGEVGTVVSIPTKEDPSAPFQVQIDQPVSKKDINSGRLMEFSTDTLITLAELAERAATRFRNMASDWDMIRSRFDGDGVQIAQVEKPVGNS